MKKKDLRLTSFFSIVTIPVMVAAIVLLVLVYRLVVFESMRQQVQHNNIIIAKTLSNVISDQLSVLEVMPESNQSLMLNDIYSDVIDSDIHKFLENTPVLKVKFFNSTGRTIYSTDKKQIGVQKPADYPGSISARTGEPFSRFSHREHFDAIDGVRNNIEVMSTYMPTYDKQTGNLHGVFEIYTDVTDQLKSIKNSLYNFTGILLFIFTFIYCALHLLVRHADKIISLNKDDLKNKIHEVEKVNETLAATSSELEAARDVANHANLSKSQFLANMSHELRTPLNAILGYTDLIREDTRRFEDEDINADLDKVKQSGKHLLELIDGILDLSKIEAGQMDLHLENFDIFNLLSEVADTVAPLTNKNHNSLQVDVDYKDILIHGDVLKIRQILFNLISNAAKFTTNGVITLKSRLLTINDETKIVFEVSDTGIGIAHKDLAKLFDPFEQADTSTTRKYGGTGLGLTITKRFCTMMGGEIEVDSKEGRGTKFIVYLPYVEGASVALKAV